MESMNYEEMSTASNKTYININSSNKILVENSSEAENSSMCTTLINYTQCVNESILIQNYNNELPPVRDSLAIVIPISIIYCIIFVTGVIGNISTCIVISRNKSMHTATNYYLFSLAISDFVLLVSSVPVEIFIIWYKYPYMFGETFCILRGVLAEASANATVLTVLTFTIERYVAICHPFLSHTLSKLSRAVKLIIIVWVVSFAYAIPQALQFGVVKIMNVDQCVVTKVIIQHSFELSTFLFFFAPMTLITALYILIGLKLRASTNMKRVNGSMQKRYHNTTQSTRRVIKMLVCVVAAFFCCWAPFHAQRLIYIYGTNNDHQASHPIVLKVYIIMTYVSGILYYLSTCINPLLYNIMSHKFREAFKETLAKICGFTTKDASQKRAYRMFTRSQRAYYHASSSKQDSSEYSGNSYRDGSMYSSGIQKQSCDTIALCFNNRHLYRDKYLNSMDCSNSHSDNNYSGRVYHNQEKSFNANNFVHNSNINIETRSVQEIYLNIIPASDSELTFSDTEMNSNPPKVKINIDIPSSSDTKPFMRPQIEPNISVIYNKQGNVQIAIAHNTHFKMKHLKSKENNKLNKLAQLFKFKKRRTRNSMSFNSPLCHASLKKMFDENLLQLEQGKSRRYSTKRPSTTSSYGAGDSYNRYRNESELDAYMRELRMRQNTEN